jgi:hypothetical protein
VGFEPGSSDHQADAMSIASRRQGETTKLSAILKGIARGQQLFDMNSINGVN